MANTEEPVQAMRELLQAELHDGERISVDELDRRAVAAHLGEDVELAIHGLPAGEYTRSQLETRLLPEIEQRVQSRLAGFGGGSPEPAGKKGSRQGKQQGRR